MLNLRALEAEMNRQMIFWAAIELIAIMVFFLVLYVVIKNAIRDGINESRLGDRWTRAVVRSQNTAELPDMRAER